MGAPGELQVTGYVDLVDWKVPRREMEEESRTQLLKDVDSLWEA